MSRVDNELDQLKHLFFNLIISWSNAISFLKLIFNEYFNKTTEIITTIFETHVTLKDDMERDGIRSRNN